MTFDLENLYSSKIGFRDGRIASGTTRPFFASPVRDGRGAIANQASLELRPVPNAGRQARRLVGTLHQCALKIKHLKKAKLNLERNHVGTTTAVVHRPQVNYNLGE